MSSTPTIRFFSQENSDVTARKTGSTIKIKKPFRDRTVNSTSSERDEKECGAVICKETAPQLKTGPPDDDLYIYDNYSEKIIPDTFNDVHFKLSEKDTWNFISSYCDYSNINSPPPCYSPPDFDMFVKLPKIAHFNTFEDDVKDDELLEEEFVEQVPVPQLEDFDNYFDV